MTHTLHEIISSPNIPEIMEDSSIVDQLGTEIRFTAEDARLHEITPEIVSELKKAVGILIKTDAPELQKLYPAAEAAAVTHDTSLIEAVGTLLQTSYPIGPETTDPNINAINSANRSMHREFVTAMRMTGERMPFTTALSRAAVMTETITGQTFDDIIDQSDLIMSEQLGRKREAAKLRAMGVHDDERFDDAIPYDPFAEDKAA